MRKGSDGAARRQRGYGLPSGQVWGRILQPSLVLAKIANSRFIRDGVPGTMFKYKHAVDVYETHYCLGPLQLICCTRFLLLPLARNISKFRVSVSGPSVKKFTKTSVPFILGQLCFSEFHFTFSWF